MRSTDSDVMRTVVRSVCERIDTPRALSVWLCFKYNQDALVELPLPDIAGRDPIGFQLDYFVTEYLSKYKGLSLRVKPRKVALRKWRLTEDQCRKTNETFRAHSRRPFDSRVERVFHHARRKIGMVLGSPRWSLVLDACKWGPGATFDLCRMDATPDKKISQAISVTAQALPYLRAVIEADPHWGACFFGMYPEGPYSLLSNCFQIVRGSRFLTVPKNAKTDRCIAAEPTGNGFLQQGVHCYIRRRLKRFGVDLDDQSINQRAARDAFACGLSTLDLSAASDTISRELVYHLLPLDWAIFLDDLRSHETRVDGEWVRTEKFASMGNAFCFELETLIFWALTSSVDECQCRVAEVAVYGDDIIVPREAYDSVVEILTISGFTINEKKSFKDGYFFESCGKHYYMGHEVTPVYQKEELTHPSELIRAHNRLVRLVSRILRHDGDVIVNRACHALCNAYKRRPFPRIPFGTVEDGGFLRPLSEFTLDPNHGFRCRVLDFVPRFTRAREDAMYAYKLRRIERINAEPRGYADNVTQGTWREKFRWIPESSARPAVAMSPPPKVLLGLA